MSDTHITVTIDVKDSGLKVTDKQQKEIERQVNLIKADVVIKVMQILRSIDE